MIKNYDTLLKELKNLDIYLKECGLNKRAELILIGGTVKFAYAKIFEKEELNNTRETPDIDFLCLGDEIVDIGEAVGKPFDYIGVYFEMPNGIKIDVLGTLSRDEICDLLTKKENLIEFPEKFESFRLYVPKVEIYMLEKERLGRNKDSKDLEFLKKAFSQS